MHPSLCQTWLETLKFSLDRAQIAVVIFRYSDPEQIRKLLTVQFYKPVKWEQIIQTIYRRMPGLEFPDTYEIGPKRELGILLKRTNMKAYAYYKHIEV